MRKTGESTDRNSYAMIDGNEAAASIAFKTNEVIVIYPITPASPMGEWADQWAAAGKTNLWGSVPLVQEMQSEGGAAGAIHGALQTGALATTFTASQGLLLMLPNMYKIAGELTPCVIHVAARSVATHALSIFGDHSDVMAARATGFALLAAGSVQEALDFSLISQAATLRSRIPFLHFFDGFRTSHEIAKVGMIPDSVIREMISEESVLEHRARGLSPDRPVIRGTAQNPDVFFQHREASNPFYDACPDTVGETMGEFERLTGRSYGLFEYFGAPDADRVIVVMGSAAEAVHETVDQLVPRGESVGLVKVRLYRPFDIDRFAKSLPPTARSLAVLDRTKEPGSAGEPLYQDVVTALHEIDGSRLQARPRVIGGRYGLASKEFTPAMARSVFDELARETPRKHFSVGIRDDVTQRSLDYDESFSTQSPDVVQAVFYGLGSDGTVSANKNTIKIIGEKTAHHAQGYFVYDSKKAGSTTVSHLRFGPRAIRSSYLVERADFVAVHQFSFLARTDALEIAKPEALFLLNSPHPPDQVWDHLPRTVQEAILAKRLRFFVIDAYRLARELGLRGRINTIMQTCFFALSEIMPREQAFEAIKESIEASYGKQGKAVVEMNFQAVDRALSELHEVKIPDRVTSEIPLWTLQSEGSPPFVCQVTAGLLAGKGDSLPVSALPADGTYPVGTARLEKRNISAEIPVWEPDICIQCGKCALVCPHSVIRINAYSAQHLDQAPSSFKSTPGRDPAWKDLSYTIQVAPEDCTGCAICVDVCPAKSKSEARVKALNMKPQEPLLEGERKNWEFFQELPLFDRNRVKRGLVKHSQLLEPLFEFSGACAGCGETPYVKLMTQLFGDRALVANATGCSSIYGGNLPTTPWTCNAEGRGPAWSNSLFEDNAEFGLGFRLSVDQQSRLAAELLNSPALGLDAVLIRDILKSEQEDESEIFEQRQRVEKLKATLRSLDKPEARRLLGVADWLVKKSIWIVGGDGWAYDIGFGGLDHVLASGQDVNILVLDTEVYSNTGGQMSKATPRGAVAKFAAAGKPLPKKDLARIAIGYGGVYVATVAMGARDEHTLRAFLEAESYPGPSLIIAYSHCIAHGINMTTAMQNQKAAVLSGYWPLLRFDPRLAEQGKNPLQLDSKAPRIPFREYAERENRFRILALSHPAESKRLIDLGQQDIEKRWEAYENLAKEASLRVQEEPSKVNRSS